MLKLKKVDLNNVSKLRKAIVTVGIMIFLFWGIAAGAISVSKFENYIHPYFFGFSFATIGLIIGIIIAKKIKPYIVITKKMHTDFFNIILAISVGFIGTSMLLGHSLNVSLSVVEKCDNYMIVDRQFHKGGFRKPELNIIKINIDGEIFKLLCKHKYWTMIEIGQKVNVCRFKSNIGFDYLVLNEHN